MIVPLLQFFIPTLQQLFIQKPDLFLLFYFINLLPSLKELIVNLFGSDIEFVMDQEKIYCRTNVMDNQYFYLIPLPRQRINFITYKGKHYVKDIEVKAQLKIYIDDIAFSLPHVYSEEELQWLADELSNWLNIPIKEPKFKNEVTEKNTN